MPARRDRLDRRRDQEIVDVAFAFASAGLRDFALSMFSAHRYAEGYLLVSQVGVRMRWIARRRVCAESFWLANAQRHLNDSEPGRMAAWRKGWDSNPRGAYTPGGFQDRCLKPLGHPSAFDFLSTFGAGRSLKWLTCYRFATVCSRCPPLPSASIWRSAEHR